MFQTSPERPAEATSAAIRNMSGSKPRLSLSSASGRNMSCSTGASDRGGASDRPPDPAQPAAARPRDPARPARGPPARAPRDPARARPPCDNGPMPILATYFSVRRGRDPFFKFFMRTLFPRQVKEYEERFGIRFIGWYNVAHGWDFDNVILLDLPDYATLDKLEADEATRALGHRAGEWIFERHHSMFLRERMGTDLEYHR